jgi:hypothetical protein
MSTTQTLLLEPHPPAQKQLFVYLGLLGIELKALHLLGK